MTDSFYGTGGVLRYSGISGEFLGVFASTQGFPHPRSIAFGPDGNLFVGMATSSHVLRFKGDTGAPFPAAGQSGAIFIDGASGPFNTAIAFGPDGRLYVSSGEEVRYIRRYDSVSGEFLGVFAPDETDTSWYSDMAFLDSGDLLANVYLNNSVARFAGDSGIPLGDFIPSSSGGLGRPQAIALSPRPACVQQLGEVRGFSWIDTSSGKVLDPIAPGTVLIPEDLTQRAIVANTSPTLVGSVRFEVNNAIVTDSAYPYAYPVDQLSTFSPLSLALGKRYALKATPYQCRNRRGLAGFSQSLQFSVLTCPFPPNAPTPPIGNGTLAISRVCLINRNSWELIECIGPGGIMRQGPGLLEENIGLYAETSPSVVGSVRVELNNEIRTDNTQPYGFGDNSDCGVSRVRVQAGLNPVSVVPYPDPNRGGVQGPVFTGAIIVGNAP